MRASSLMQPKAALRGKEGASERRMANPHSPSTVISRGTLASFCARLVRAACPSMVPFPKRRPPILYLRTHSFRRLRVALSATAGTRGTSNCPTFSWRLRRDMTESTHAAQRVSSVARRGVVFSCACAAGMMPDIMPRRQAAISRCFFIQINDNLSSLVFEFLSL